MDRLKRLLVKFYRQPRLTLLKLLRMIKLELFSTPKGKTIEKIDSDVRFEFGPKWTSMMKRMYFNLYEMMTVSVLEKYLQPGDVFFDVGANIGYLTARGLTRVGNGGEIHSFEPVRKYYKRLKRTKELNPDYKLYLNQVALGEKQEKKSIQVSTENIGWNTIVPGFMERFSEKEQFEREQINIIRLDKYCFKQNIDKIDFIKIDVEGYELPLLKGFENWLKKTTTEAHPKILCEVAPQGYETLDYSLQDLADFISSHNYRAVRPGSKNNEIDITNLTQTQNLLFIKNYVRCHDNSV